MLVSDPPLKIRFIPKSAAVGTRRADKVLHVAYEEPRLESFVNEDLQPSTILAGAGLLVPDDGAASAVIEAGLPASVVRDFAAACGVTLAELGWIVGTSERTMSRKLAKRAGLEPAESDRAYRLFDVVARAVHAFGDVDKARRWLQRVLPSLGSQKPIRLLRTEIGTRQVLSALDRIEFGGIA
ncbi:MAG: antitoxin Xre/MbcA/ParS toxin-binding domain-containing protein [Candidatus Velthaea sp.]